MRIFAVPKIYCLKCCANYILAKKYNYLPCYGAGSGNAPKRIQYSVRTPYNKAFLFLKLL